MPGRGQGRSTFSTGDTSRFRAWLLEQLEHYGWSRGRLAKEIDVSKGAVVRWLQPDDVHTYRRPSFENLQRLAEVFGVELDMLLDYAGIRDEDETPAETALQRESASIVRTMPDTILATVHPMLRALAVEGQRDDVLATIRQSLGCNGEKPVAT